MKKIQIAAKDISPELNAWKSNIHVKKIKKMSKI